MKILLASNNKKKLNELKAILGDNFQIVTLEDAGIISDPEETGTTFEENAEIKAKSGCEKSGMCCLADDSGLVVEALNGEPGVYSARYSGENHTDKKNNDLLLEKMKNLDNRKAKFVSVICFYMPNGEKYFAYGECQGMILRSELGDNGFGYDPLFYVEEYKKTFAQLDGEEKNRISHRANALKEIKKILEN